MGRIVVLPPAVQGQIAAGEVIERPASIVKELVENAVDAGAARIDVQLERGGLERIAVVDDGEGMEAEQAVLAFARHATSKLARIEDLASVGSFGFRGEALPSIAAAGRVRLTTRRREGTAAAVVEACGASAALVGPAAAAPGTRVEVSDLFATTPARRKFLRQPATELGHVNDVLTRLAAACPQIGFRLLHDRREVLSLPPASGLRQRLAQILGTTRAEELTAVEGRGGEVTIDGLVGSPRDSLSSARLLWTYVAIGEADAARPRWVRDRVLLRAVLDGYESLLMRGRYPLACLVVRLAPGAVDVNVHPAKLEVRFRESQAVHRVLSSSIRALLRRRLQPAAAGEEPAPGVAADAPDAEPRPRPLVIAAPGSETAAAPSARALEQRSLWTAAPQGFGALRFVAQLFDGYLLCDAGDRLVLVDQHAAHERVLYERLQARRGEAEMASQALLVPEVVPLAASEVALLAEHTGALAELGLAGEPFGADAYLLRTVPRVLRGRDVGALLHAVVADLAGGGAARAVGAARDALLASMACHAATRVGDRLAASEAEALLASMDGVPVNAHCPHGRPVAIQLTRGQVETLFGR